MRLFKKGKVDPDDDLFQRYNLNKDKVDALDDLTSDRRYVMFMSLLQEIAEERGLNLLLYKNESDFRFWQGHVSCLREMQTLIPTIVDKVKNQDARPRPEHRREPGSDKRTFFGAGPWWDISGASRKPDA